MTQIIAVVGPSGAGKDTLIEGALAARPSLRLARRAITRPSGAGGEDFDGVTEAAFATRRDAGDFALHWQAHGLHYGIPKAALTGPGTVLFNCSRAALTLAQQHIPNLRVILVTAPDAIRAARLAQRGREAPADIAQRLARASFALPEGLTATTVQNDGTPAEGIVRFLKALQPANG